MGVAVSTQVSCFAAVDREVVIGTKSKRLVRRRRKRPTM